MAHEEELKKAIQLIRAGDKQAGGKVLHDILMANQDLELAWLWLSACVDTEDDKRYCLQEVMRINPANQPARKGLESMGIIPPPMPPPPVLQPTEDDPLTARLAQATAAPAGTASPAASGSEAGAAFDPQSFRAAPGAAEAGPTSPISDSAPLQAPAASTSRPAATYRAQPPAGNQRPAWMIPSLIGVLVLVITCVIVLAINPEIIRNIRLGGGTNIQAAELQIEYIVTGTTTQAQVSFHNAEGKMETWDVRKLPYTKTVTMSGQTHPSITMVVENMTSAGNIYCEIKVNGVSKTNNGSAAPRGFASCSALP